MGSIPLVSSSKIAILYASLLLTSQASAQASGSQSVTGICGIGNICTNGACCAVAPGATSGCYGPDYCGTTNLTSCISNCDAKAQCGPNAEASNFNCPLNVCCSQYGFCGTTDEFCGAGCSAGCNIPSNPTTGCASSSSLKKVIGYYEGWSISQPCDVIFPEELPVGAYTHLYFSFGSIDPVTYAVVPASPSDVPLYTRITNLKQVNPALRCYISIGGWSFNDPGSTFTTFSNLSSSAAHRSAFAGSLINFMVTYGFDGVDIDWEYPAAPERGGSPADRENFVTLMADLRSAFDLSGHPNFGITFTAPSSYYYMQNFDIPAMLKYADWVNVMTYDLHGTWDANDIWVGPYLLAHTNLTEMELTLELLWRVEVPADQVVLGIGFYGRSFTVSDPHCTTPGYTCTFTGGGKPGPCTQSSGTLSYAEIMQIIATNNLVGTLDPVSGAKYVVWDTDQWVSYDDEETFSLKTAFADRNCLGGVMIWSADQDTLAFDALNSLLDVEVLGPQPPPIPKTLILPNGQNCASTANCGDPCPTGYIQVNSNGKPAYVPDGCPSDSPRKICCPVTAVPSSCQWTGSGDCSNGYCSDGQVTVAVSKSGDGSNCRGDASSHKEFCCSTSLSSYTIEGICEWASECTSITCPSDFPVIQTTAQGYPHCSVYGLSGHLQPLCCSSNAFKNCAWHGSPSSDCSDNFCPAGQFVLRYDVCGDLPIGECCPYNTQRLYCCDPPSALEDPVPVGDLFEDPPDQTQADLTYRIEILDGSGSTDPNAHAFGSLFLDGDSADITSMSTEDWVVVDCDPSLETAQQVRVFCTQDFKSSSCNDLTTHHTVDTIVKLPTSCSKGNYVRVGSFAVAQNQSLAAKHRALKPKTEAVYDLQFDYAFDQIDASSLSDEIIFRVDTSNIPGYWNSVVDSAPTGVSRLGKREIQARWWGAFLDWLQGVTAIDVSATKRLDVAGPKSFNYPLFNKQVACPAIGLTASATIGVSGQVSIPITYGVIIMGSLLPSPSITESYVFLDASASASATFYAMGEAQVIYNSEVVNLFKQSVYGFSFDPIVTIGPALLLDAYITGQVNLAGNFAAGFQFTSPSYHFAVPDNTANGNSPPGTADMSSHVTPTFTASASASGSISVHLVPRAQIGIEIGWKGTKAIDAVASISLDSSLTFGFQAQASTEGSSACLYADAGLFLYGGISGSLLGTNLAGSANATFFQSPAYNLFQTPSDCHSSTPIPRKRGLEELPNFSWERSLVSRDTPSSECPGIIECSNNDPSSTPCSGAQDSDCWPNSCNYDTTSGTVGRRSLSSHSTRKRPGSSLHSFLPHEIIGRDSTGGSGGARTNVKICGLTTNFPAVNKRGLLWYDYEGDLSSPAEVFEFGLQRFDPNQGGFLYQVGAGNPRFPENQASYYNVVGDFEFFLRGNFQVANSDIDDICDIVSTNDFASLKAPILTPGSSAGTGNLVMAPFGMNSFKFQAFSGNQPPSTAGVDAGTALRRLKYFAALGYYMSDDVVNALFKDTSLKIKNVWIAAAAQSQTNPQLATTIGNLYDTWMTGKVNAAETYAQTASQRYVTYLQGLTSWCYGVTLTDLNDYKEAIEDDLTIDNFDLP